MSLTTMYPAKNNSPKTYLSAAISAEDTSLTLQDASVLPAAPNLLVLGFDDNAEVVIYSKINGNEVSGLIRGVGGTMASLWSEDTIVARNFTAKDAEAFRENILDLDDRKANASDAYTEREVDDLLDAKQDMLTFDSTPTASSTNPVTSGGVKTALDGKSETGHIHDERYYTESEMDTKLDAKAPLASPALTGTPTAPTQTKGNSSTRLATTAFVQTAIGDKQDTLTFDTTPTANSTKPVTSGGVKTALDAKLNLSGGTMTGNLLIGNSKYLITKHASDSETVSPSANTYISGLSIQDSNGKVLSTLRTYHPTSGNIETQLFTRRTVNDANVYNQVLFGIKADGTRYVSFTDNTVWRNGLGASSGVWPVSIGGTGGTDSGWKSLTNTSTFTGTIYYRKIGQWVEVRAYQIKLAADLTTNSGVGLATLPSGFRPSTTGIGAPAGNANNGMGMITIVTGGAIKFYKPITATSYPTSANLYFSCMFMIG